MEQPQLFKRKYYSLFALFAVSICIVFIFVRPLNSPWQRFIAGDGLGYYSYLPAKYIYHDNDLNFNWFSQAYSSNYASSSFVNPADNFLTEFNGRKINKYYQGLSFIWLPFFLIAHFIAKLTHFPADGFSLPYQLAMAAASIFYLLLGLAFLIKLLVRFFNNYILALFSACLIFYGTALFNYSVFNNSLSHVYSFSFITLFCYYAWLFFNTRQNRARNLLFTLLFLVIVVCIRPLNILTVVIPLAFIPKEFKLSLQELNIFNKRNIIVITLIGAAIYNQLSISHTQTGSFFPYTYGKEQFNFKHVKFLQSLVSYNIGLFVYAPLLLISMFGIIFLPKSKKIILPLLFFGVLFLYSAWWYWPILKRCMVDYSLIPALFLTALFIRLATNRFNKIVWAISIVCVFVYQFKEMQIRKGIISEFETDEELYWRHFLRTSKASIYPVPQKSIIESKICSCDFENNQKAEYLSTQFSLSGSNAVKLNAEKGFCDLIECPYPNIFDKNGLKKIRATVNFKFNGHFEKVHVFIRLFNKEQQSILDVPFYLSAEDMSNGNWDLKEFGYEVTDSLLYNKNTIDKIGIAVWNVDGRNDFFVDDVKLEFLITDNSFGTALP